MHCTVLRSGAPFASVHWETWKSFTLKWKLSIYASISCQLWDTAILRIEIPTNCPCERSSSRRSIWRDNYTTVSSRTQGGWEMTSAEIVNWGKKGWDARTALLALHTQHQRQMGMLSRRWGQMRVRKTWLGADAEKAEFMASDIFLLYLIFIAQESKVAMICQTVQ